MQENSIFNSIQLDEQGSYYLKEAAKWARFLGIMGYVFMAIMLIAGLVIGFLLPEVSGMPGFAFAIIYIIIAAVYVYPIIQLHQFGAKAKTATLHNDAASFNASLKCLKNCFLYIGVVTIITISIYALIIIFAGIGVMDL